MIKYNFYKTVLSFKKVLFLFLIFCIFSIYSFVQYRYLPKSLSFDSFMLYFLNSENLIVYFFPIFCIFFVIKPIIDSIESDHVLLRMRTYSNVLQSAIKSSVVLSVLLTLYLFSTFLLLGIINFGFSNVGIIDNGILILKKSTSLEFLVFARLFISYILYFVFLTLFSFVIRIWIKNKGVFLVSIYSVNLIIFNVLLAKSPFRTLSIIYLFTGDLNGNQSFQITPTFWYGCFMFLIAILFLLFILLLFTKQIYIEFKISKYVISKEAVSLRINTFKFLSVIMLLFCQFALLSIWKNRLDTFPNLSTQYNYLGKGIFENMLLLCFFIFISIYNLPKLENELNCLLPTLLPRYGNRTRWLNSYYLSVLRVSTYLSLILLGESLVFMLFNGMLISIGAILFLLIKLFITIMVANGILLLLNLLFSDTTRALVISICVFEAQLLISQLTGKIFSLLPISILYMDALIIDKIVFTALQLVALTLLTHLINIYFIREETKWKIS